MVSARFALLFSTYCVSAPSLYLRTVSFRTLVIERLQPIDLAEPSASVTM